MKGVKPYKFHNNINHLSNKATGRQIIKLNDYI